MTKGQEIAERCYVLGELSMLERNHISKEIDAAIKNTAQLEEDRDSLCSALDLLLRQVDDDAHIRRFPVALQTARDAVARARRRK